MMNFNRVILMGRLTAHPTLRVFDDGNKVVNFCIATNRTWKGADDQRREETCFVDCKAFGTRAQAISDYFPKGRPLFIEGHLHLEKWVDKDTQKNMSRLRVVVDNFEFLDKKSSTEDGIPASAGNSFMSGSHDDFDSVVDDAVVTETATTEVATTDTADADGG